MNHAPESDPDRRAKDLLRAKEIQVRRRLGERTLARLWYRMGRRPAGSSKRLWAKVGEPDPFTVPEEEVKPEYRTVYAAGRFVRVDQAEKESKRPNLPPRPPPREAAPAPTADKKAPQRSAVPPAIAKKYDESQLFTPTFGKKPGAAPAGRPGQGSATPVDRTPPIVPPNATGSVSPAGRIRTAAAPRRVPSGDEGSGPAPAPPMRAPQTVVAKPATPTTAPAPKPPAAPTPPPPAKKPEPALAAPPAAPPPSATVAAPSAAPVAPPPSAAALKKGEVPTVGSEVALPPMKSIPGALNTPGPAQVVPLRKPTRVEAEPEPQPTASGGAPPAPRAPPSPSGGGLDDLFGGGAQEGRVRIAPRRKAPTEGGT